MSFRNTDKILVHREGSDYQADMRPLIPQKWTPTSRSGTAQEKVFPGESTCRPGYPEAHNISDAVPQHVQLPDFSHNYIVTVVCGGGNFFSEPCYFLMLDNELNITKTIQPPVVGQTLTNAHLQSFPNSSPYDGIINNILVWNHPDGIWCSQDYGDTWIKFENVNGGTGNLTVDNCKLYFQLEGGQYWRNVLTFNKIADPTGEDGFCYDNINITEYDESVRNPNFVDEYLYQNDINLKPNYDTTYSWYEDDVPFPYGKQLLSTHYTLTSQQFNWTAAGDGNWNAASKLGYALPSYLISCDPGAYWEYGADFPSMTIVQSSHTGKTIEVYEEKVFEKWFETIQPLALKADPKMYLRKWAIAWDPSQEAFLCHYSGNDLFNNGDPSGVHMQIIATRNFQTGWLPYLGGFSHTIDELDIDAATSSNDAFYGDSNGNVATGLVSRLPGSSTGLFLAGSNAWGLDAPFNGQVLVYGSSLSWIVPLIDGRLWSGPEVTVQPYYSLKPGLVLDGHFIEVPSIEVGSPLTLPFDYKSVPLDLTALPPLS